MFAPLPQITLPAPLGERTDARSWSGLRHERATERKHATAKNDLRAAPTVITTNRCVMTVGGLQLA